MTPGIRVFSTGRVREKLGTRGLRRYLNDAWRPETLPVNVFLIEHPAGRCLVDTGQTAHATSPGYFSWWYPYFRLSRFELTPDDEIAAQLGRAGVPPATVRWIVLTHLHTDHVGGLGAFVNAEVLVARAEWEPAQGLGGRFRGYQPQYWPRGIVPTLVDFAGPAIGPFRGSQDLAADGRLVMVPLPGHTRGHAGLLVGDGQRFRCLCAGDAAHCAEELERQAPAVAEWCRREGITVLASHDDHAAAMLANRHEGLA
jgi:glyoxylase-like metal-dependent hydrolase (beta-lactamase superfamily II)